MTPSPSVAPTASATPSATPGDPSIATDKKIVNRQGRVVVTLTGFKPGSSVEIWLTSDPILLATVLADGDGNVETTVDIPANAPLGNHHLRAVGVDPTDAPLTLTEGIQVVAPPETSTTDSGSGVILLLMLIGLGSAAALVVKPRRIAARTSR